MLVDRDNKAVADERVRNTMRVFNLLREVSPDPVFAAEAASLLDLEEGECLVIMISLSFDEWIRETERGFQTLGQPIDKIGLHGHAAMDRFFTGGLGETVPRRRYPEGAWQAA